MTQEGATATLKVERDLAQAPAKVFAAFASKDTIAAWIAPDASIPVSVDVFTFAPEGRYRFRFHMPDGTVLPLEGVFLTIDAPRRLTFTWQWQPPDVHAGIDSLVDIELVPRGTGTRLVLSHSRLKADGMVARHELGWHAATGRLADLTSRTSGAQ